LIVLVPPNRLSFFCLGFKGGLGVAQHRRPLQGSGRGAHHPQAAPNLRGCHPN